MGFGTDPLTQVKRDHLARQRLERELAAERARVSELTAENEAFRAECDKVGIPYDAPGLVRHHRGNAAMAAGADAYVEIRKIEAERDAAVARTETERARREAVEADARQWLHRCGAAAQALVEVGKKALVVKTTLDQPYPDAPDQTPWTRFMERPAREAYNLGCKLRKDVRAALAAAAVPLERGWRHARFQEPHAASPKDGTEQVGIGDRLMAECATCGEVIYPVDRPGGYPAAVPLEAPKETEPK